MPSKARLSAIDGAMNAVGNLNSERMKRMRQDTTGDNEGEDNITQTPQFPDREMDDINVVQAKGSDADASDHALDQRRAAPQNQDTSDGDVDADTGETEPTGTADDAWQTLRDAEATGDSTAKRVASLFGDEPNNDLPMHGEGAPDMEIQDGSPEGATDAMEGEEANNEPDDMYGAWDADRQPSAMEAGGGDAPWDNDAIMPRNKSAIPQTPGAQDASEMGGDTEPDFSQYPGVKLPRKRR